MGQSIPGGFVDDLETGGLTYEQIEQKYDLSKDQARRRFETLRENGRAVEHVEVSDSGKRRFFLDDQSGKRFSAPGDGTYRFGLISDTHLGSQEEHLDELNDFYDRIAERGIDMVLHCGDISDGYEVYRHHVNELKSNAIGWSRLKNYVVDNYPQRDGVTTHFITGNHDYKFYKATGLYFGAEIDSMRDDLNWLGEMNARVVFEDGVDLELIHPSGGSPYTLGYRAQTLYRERPLDERPTFGVVGHIHGKLHGHAEGVEVFYPGCWQGTTTYIKRKGLSSTIGGWIVELEIEDGDVRRIKPEWIGYETQSSDNEYDVESLA